MSKVTCGITASLDGFVAASNQSFEKPFGDMPEGLLFLGDGLGDILHEWMFDEPQAHMEERKALGEAGAFVMGGNMFGPKDRRLNDGWKGWWGDDPPFHAPVFVLSHTARVPFSMKGGTTFSFVTDGIESALAQAKKAAGEKDVAISGGANTINQFLAAGLIDELWLHIVPVTIGAGARLFENVPNLRMEPVSCGGTKLVTHIKYRVLH
jgi:dihydrofolate reductase